MSIRIYIELIEKDAEAGHLDKDLASAACYYALRYLLIKEAITRKSPPTKLRLLPNKIYWELLLQVQQDWLTANEALLQQNPDRSIDSHIKLVRRYKEAVAEKGWSPIF